MNADATGTASSPIIDLTAPLSDLLTSK